MPVGGGRRVRVVALLLAALTWLPGCGSQPSTGTDVAKIEAEGKDFVENAPEMRALFRQNETSATANIRFEVYVDESLSMHGYADYARNWRQPPDSNFVRLLRELNNEGELLGYYGFGNEATPTQIIVPHGKAAPLDPGLYNKSNNDYADLLRQLASLPKSSDGLPIERMIITDGVQSSRDAGQGSALSQTVQKLQEWIAHGGVVEVRLLAAPFSGTYYSEELRALKRPSTFQGRVTDRPFIVISLLSGPADLPAWDRFWNRNAMSAVRTLGMLRCPVELPARAIELVPEERIPKDVPTDVLYRNVWDLVSLVTLDGYRNMWRAMVSRPRTQENADPATFPACFLVKGVAAADPNAAFRALKPMLEVWQRPAPPGNVPDGKKPAAADHNWQKLESVDLRDFRNGKVTIAPAGSPADAFRLTATLPVPARKTAQAVVLRAAPPASGAPPTPPDWRSSSTLNDSSAADLNKIYNLQPFVEQLTDRTARPPSPTGLLVLTYR